MIQEEFNIDKNDGYQSRVFLQNALRQYKPGVFEQMSETFQSHISNSTISSGVEALQQSYGSQDTIPEELWTEENRYFRKGIDWHEEMTNVDARILSERFDREDLFNMKMRNTDPFSIHNIGAALGAAVFDPLSYIPFVGPVSKIGKGLSTVASIARIGKHTSDIGKSISMQGVLGGATFASTRINQVTRLSKFISPVKATIKGVTSPFKPVAVYGMEGVLAESAFQTIRNMADARQEEDIDYMGGVFDVMIAGLFGGVLGTLPMANIFRKNFKKEQLHQALIKASNDLGDKGYVGMDGIPPNAEVRLSPEDVEINVKAEMDSYDSTVEHIVDKDISPIRSYFKDLQQDTVAGLHTAIAAYRRCGS